MNRIILPILGLIFTIVFGYTSYQEKEQQLQQAKSNFNTTLKKLAFESEEKFTKFQNKIENCQGNWCLNASNPSSVIASLELIGNAYAEEGCQAHIDAYSFLKAQVEHQYELYKNEGIEAMQAFKLDTTKVQTSFNNLKKDCVI